jgi:sensor domain CHASE-containing protein
MNGYSKIIIPLFLAMLIGLGAWVINRVQTHTLDHARINERLTAIEHKLKMRWEESYP